MTRQHNPPHPGEVLRELWLEPLGASVTDAAKALNVSRKTLSAILNGRQRVTAEMALRLSIALGTTPEMWINLQTARDLWELEQHKEDLHVRTLAA